MYHILPLTHTHVYICTNHIFTTHINISLPLQRICTIPTHHIYIKYTTHTHHITYTIYTIQLILSIRHACIHYQAIIQDFLYHTYTYTTYIHTHHTDTYTIHTYIHTTPYIQTLVHAIHVQYISHKYTLHPSIYAHTYILHALLISHMHTTYVHNTYTPQRHTYTTSRIYMQTYNTMAHTTCT